MGKPWPRHARTMRFEFGAEPRETCCGSAKETQGETDSRLPLMDRRSHSMSIPIPLNCWSPLPESSSGVCEAVILVRIRYALLLMEKRLRLGDPKTRFSCGM